MKLKKTIFYALLALFSNSLPLSCVEVEEEPALHKVQFEDIPISEFIRFVGKVSNENFIFNKDDLNFNVTFSSGEPISSEQIVKAVIRILGVHHLQTEREGRYLIIQKGEGDFFDPAVLAASADGNMSGGKSGLTVCKLQYHEGAEIVDALKQMAADAGGQGLSPQVIQAIGTLQWIKMTNSLLFSASGRAAAEMKKIIASLDVPLKQVFIEILVIETDVQKGKDFGIDWAVAGKYKDRVGGGFGNFSPHIPHTPGPGFIDSMRGPGGPEIPAGLGKLPFTPGFDLGVIGDIITHKGASFLSLGTLVSALQLDGDSTIVLNQKIITQDNKVSKIFVGDNIPFTGSVVTTVGQGQQTTANIEYRDVGVSLTITPKIGDEDIVTLSLDEEITEAVFDNHSIVTNVNGIRTTKTNMLTHVHVPDQHFLVLSGMIRNAKSVHKTGIPCLGGLPIIGTLFSKTKKQDEKRNVIVFVRPQIIHSFNEYKNITKNQEKLYEKQANAKDFQEGLELVVPLGEE
jgi:type III secretion protein C